MRQRLHVRRHDLTPRVEMLPMLDVIFLLLTFFIYSLLVMVRAEVLPVELVPVGTGEAAQTGTVKAITIDRAGQIYLNREPVDNDTLDSRLSELAEADDPPRLFLAMESTLDGDAAAGPAVDRGPMLVALINRVQRAGLYDFVIVGEPGGGGGAGGGASGGGGGP
ncbi:ExbD/TolR family protein [Phycisphaerales bacterium AB-hyl4]|uniref:ExbD/TolR family protein n=1 Tax=Natronomicrosphaera hydrolytica TaxID=3242702 RepID=A0ABV4U2S5_9BACT